MKNSPIPDSQKNYLVNKDLPKSLPELPGVYTYQDKDKKPIYIGKAKNLKSRTTSYFVNDLLPKTKAMLNEAKYFSFILVANEFEALLLEANMVRKNMPKYNVQLRDDKSPLYIVITDEEFPRVQTARKSDLGNFKVKKLYGPFISSLVVRRVLRNLRKIFPFSTHKLGNRGCLYSQIGLCNPCPNVIAKIQDLGKYAEEKKQYAKNIKNLTLTLEGKLQTVRKDLAREMAEFSKRMDYENANKLKKQLSYIDYISTPISDVGVYVENPSFLEDIRDRELVETMQLLSNFYDLKSLKRIECFDIAHIASSFPTASMVTFIDGEADKKLYRHFKINPDLKGDTDRMAEVIKRRMKHFDDWGKPDLIIVDGGKPQVSVVQDILKDTIPLVGIAKQYETLVIKHNSKFIEIRLKPPVLYLFQRLRDEAHRLSRRLHHKQVAKIFDNK
jgi:excinuclease ABC subunit C